MTYREILQKAYPDRVDPGYIGGCKGCPGLYGLPSEPCSLIPTNATCSACWDRDAPEGWPQESKFTKFQPEKEDNDE